MAQSADHQICFRFADAVPAVSLPVRSGSGSDECPDRHCRKRRFLCRARRSHCRRDRIFQDSGQGAAVGRGRADGRRQSGIGRDRAASSPRKEELGRIRNRARVVVDATDPGAVLPRWPCWRPVIDERGRPRFLWMTAPPSTSKGFTIRRGAPPGRSCPTGWRHRHDPYVDAGGADARSRARARQLGIASGDTGIRIGCSCSDRRAVALYPRGCTGAMVIGSPNCYSACQRRRHLSIPPRRTRPPI